MTANFLKLVSVSLTLAAFLPAVTLLTSLLNPADKIAGDGTVIRHTLGNELPFVILTLGGGWLVYEGLRDLLTKRQADLEELFAKQAIACDRANGRQAALAIGLSAVLSILLELAVIRWQAGVFELFAFYKNLSLLACFLGLGLGYATAGSRAIPLALTAPLMSIQFLALITTRHGLTFDRRMSLKGMPVLEQLNMGVRLSESLPDFIAVYWFLGTVFLLTALAFVPVGQICGRLMSRLPSLNGYGLNLAGSIVGVVLMFVLSAFYLPPVVWFAIGLGGLALFQLHDRRAFVVATGGVLAAVIVLAWPVSFGWELIYSPYQLLERGPSPNGYSMVRSAGTYYQRIHDLSEERTATTKDESIRGIARYYEFPYRIMPQAPASVLVLGAGTGNDVAAALRRGASRVDAVEIDPAILRIGKMFHPEKPYDDQRVSALIGDARNVLRRADGQYEAIVYGLLDSHTLSSHASNLRLDSFVYTVEGFREARARLKPGGLLSLSFSVMSPELGRKIYLMLMEAFDGKPPVCVQANFDYDDSMIFLQSENGGPHIPPATLERNGFRDMTAALADDRIQADVSTDDWPFFYMPKRIYPTSFLGMVALMLGIAVWMTKNLTSERPTSSEIRFFFLGAGFLLVQTRCITELGLIFGNTWHVIGIVIASMLVFAFLANLAVRRFELRRAGPALSMVLFTLGLGYWASGQGFMPAGFWGTAAVVSLATCPVFFSGIAFSCMASGVSSMGRILSANLFGAMCGGMLEYQSMYFGLRSLYLLAMLMYGLALITTKRNFLSPGKNHSDENSAN